MGDRSPSTARRVSAHGVLLGRTGQAVAAGTAYRTLYQLGAAQGGHDAFQILFGELLPLGNVPQTKPLSAAVLRHIPHDTQRVAPSG